MKKILLVCLIACVSTYAQNFDTVKITEKVKGFKKTTKEYYVLKDNKEIRHGLYKEYYKGVLVVQGAFKNDKKEGLWSYKSPKGEYLQEGMFKDGKPVGSWKRINMKGEQMETYNLSGEGKKNILPFVASKKLNQPIVLMQSASDKKKKNYNYRNFLLYVNDYVTKNLRLNDIKKLPGFVESKGGVYKMAAVFRVNTYGEICSIKTRAKNKVLEKAFEKVLKKLPTFIPGCTKERFVNILFSQPLIIGLPPKKDPFAGLEPKRNRF